MTLNKSDRIFCRIVSLASPFAFTTHDLIETGAAEGSKRKLPGLSSQIPTVGEFDITFEKKSFDHVAIILVYYR